MSYRSNKSVLYYKHVVHENVVGGSSMIGFRLVIAVSEWDMPGIEPRPLGWHTSALTNEGELAEVKLFLCLKVKY